MPPKLLVGMGALENTVTKVPANAFTININSNNEITSIKAEFSLKRLNLLKDFLDLNKFLKILVFSKNSF